METTEMSLKYCLLNYGFKVNNNSKNPNTNYLNLAISNWIWLNVSKILNYRFGFHYVFIFNLLFNYNFLVYTISLYYINLNTMMFN